MNKKQRLFLIVTFIVYIFLPLISFNIVKFDLFYNVDTVFFSFVFILVVIIISSQMGDDMKFYKVILAIAIGNGLYILPAIFFDISQLFNIDNYMWFLQSERNARATYGLRHPNFTGMIILVEIFSILFCSSMVKKVFNKLICFVLEIVLISALITTGNRAAFYAMLISTIVGICFVLLKRAPKIIRNLIIFYSVISILIFLLIIFDWNKFYSSSDSLVERSAIMKSVVDQIPIYGNYLFGIAPIDQISLSQDYIFLKNDNWFVETLVLYGLIGLVFMLALIIYLLIHEMSNYFKNKDVNSLFKLVLFIAAIVYSTMEITLFAHGYSWSLILWIIILAKLKNPELDYLNNKIVTT